MSMGGPHDDAMDELVDQASAAGFVIITAAGNDNAICNYSPSTAVTSISVGAATRRAGVPPMTREPDSNFGPNVNIFAPGDTIHSSSIDGNITPETGTSLAAPFVAGVAAYLIAYNPELNTSLLVRNRILATARPGLIHNPGANTPNLFLYNGSGG